MTRQEFINWISKSLIDIRAISWMSHPGRGGVRQKIIAAKNPMKMKALDFAYIAKVAERKAKV